MSLLKKTISIYWKINILLSMLITLVLFTISLYREYQNSISLSFSIVDTKLESLDKYLSQKDLLEIKSLLSYAINPIVFRVGISSDVFLKENEIIVNEYLDLNSKYLLHEQKKLIFNGKRIGFLELYVDPLSIVKQTFKNQSIQFFLFFLIMLFLFFHKSFLTISILEVFRNLINVINGEKLNLINIENTLRNVIEKNQKVGNKELNDILTQFFSILVEYSNQKQKIVLSKAIEDTAQQVAHDIRSPLSALSMVASTLKDIPEEKRIIIRNATQRINDIANDLLSKGKTDSVKDIAIENAEQNIISPLKSNQASGKSLRIEFLPALVDILVSEKRMQYMKRSDLEIDVDLTQGFGAFATVDDKELKRVMSNLINNSVESFDATIYESQQKKNTINIEVIKINKEQAEIVIKDNGKGIPEDILSKLGTEQLSYGKNSSAESGTGLGLYHAKKTIESMNGQFKIESALSKGTTVRLILPLSKTPDWFATEVSLVNKTMLVSLDDDTSIHQIWSGRLQSLGLSDKIQHIRFQSYELFENYINQNIDKLSQMQMLVDYELLNQSKTGLDVIEDLVLEKYAILVTSRYEESQIQERAKKLNLKILPKALSGSVPFLYAKSEIQNPNVSNINETDSYDWVLLDDDELVHMTWKFEAKNKNKKLISFKTVNELNSQKTAINKNSKIYIDSNLGNGVKGEEIAKALYDEGYAQIYLATGYQAESFQHLKFLKGVVGKDPPKD